MPLVELHHGDYRDLMHRAPFEAIVTDPPYKFAASGGGHYRKKRKMLDEIEERGLDLGFDLDLLSWKNAGSIVVFCHNDQLLEILQRLKQGFKRQCVLAWHKQNPQPVRNKHYLPDTEFFVHAWQQDNFPRGQHHDMRRWFVTEGQFDKHGHPACKPLELMRKIVRNVAADTIFDPFMGSGTTGVAAVLEGRNFIGAEAATDYHAIARRRIDAALQQVAA